MKEYTEAEVRLIIEGAIAAERETICAFLARVVDEYENMDRQGSAEDIRKFIRRIRARKLQDINKQAEQNGEDL
jgi:hypothetical protein